MSTAPNNAVIHSPPHVTDNLMWNFCRNVQDTFLSVLFWLMKWMWAVLIHIFLQIIPQNIWRRESRKSRRLQPALVKKDIGGRTVLKLLLRWRQVTCPVLAFTPLLYAHTNIFTHQFNFIVPFLARTRYETYGWATLWSIGAIRLWWNRRWRVIFWIPNV
jgi:hypothetical protein